MMSANADPSGSAAVPSHAAVTGGLGAANVVPAPQAYFPGPATSAGLLPTASAVPLLPFMPAVSYPGAVGGMSIGHFPNPRSVFRLAGLAGLTESFIPSLSSTDSFFSPFRMQQRGSTISLARRTSHHPNARLALRLHRETSGEGKVVHSAELTTHLSALVGIISRRRRHWLGKVSRECASLIPHVVVRAWHGRHFTCAFP